MNKVHSTWHAGNTMQLLMLWDPPCCLCLSGCMLSAFTFSGPPSSRVPLSGPIAILSYCDIVCAISGCGLADCRVCISFAFPSWHPAHPMVQRPKIFLVTVEIKGHKILHILFLAHNHALKCKEMKFSVNSQSKFPVQTLSML